MSIEHSIKSALLASSTVPVSFCKKTPRQYADKQHDYYGNETSLFTEQYAKYSSNYVEAEIQGLDPARPFEYTKVHIRLAEAITASASAANQIDNFKEILIAEKEYGYIRRGAKVKTLGNIWLVTNPANLSNDDGKATIQRCDAVWHYHDFYGNVCAEPMCVGKGLLRANDPDAQRSVMVAKGYFDAKMQYNEVTKQLDSNSRMILGSGAYHLSGFSDFIHEFTEDENSVNMLEFTMRWEEPNEALDDLVNKVANGKMFKWELLIDGQKNLKVGQTTKLNIHSLRTTEVSTELVVNEEEASEVDSDYPICVHEVSYEWEIDDESVATVDSCGNVTAIGEGTANITVILKQNPNITETFAINVEEIEVAPHIEISSTPESMNAYTEITINARYYENGEETDEVVEWHLSNASYGTYSYVADGNTLKVRCWNGSVNDLIIIASHENITAQRQIALLGI